jgi:uncharacterized protein (TIGR02266 family)
MSQETRKDPRGKDVNLIVRYKSATVDEFIEQHAIDVSRGGVFVKSDAPSGPGTLLKFELRIADDKPIVVGVGRVVWKRDASASDSERPAGMGVKFIKIDDASRTLIEELIARKSGAGANYEAEGKVSSGSVKPGSLSTRPAFSPAPPTTSPRLPSAKLTIAGMPPTVPPPPNEAAANIAASRRPDADAAAGEPKAARKSLDDLLSEIESGGRTGADSFALSTALSRGSAPPPAVGDTRSTFGARKSTVIGIGQSAPPPAVYPASTAPRPPPNDTYGGDDANEPTVMRQAAELLQEALREAGGSPDEIGIDFDSKDGEAEERTLVAPSASLKAAPAFPSTTDKKPEVVSAVAQTAVSTKQPIAAKATRAISTPPAAQKKSSAAPWLFGGLLLALGGGGGAAYKMGYLNQFIDSPRPAPTVVIPKPAVPKLEPTVAPILPEPGVTTVTMLADAGASAIVDASSGRTDSGGSKDASAAAVPTATTVKPPPQQQQQWKPPPQAPKPPPTAAETPATPATPATAAVAPVEVPVQAPPAPTSRVLE